MSRPRNNLMKLPAEVRYRIYRLLEDGAEYDEVRDDEIVSAACASMVDKTGTALVLHNGSILAYREGEEYAAWQRDDVKFRRGIVKNQASRILVDAEGAADDVAKLASYKLLQLCMDKLEAGDELDPKELATISGAVAAYNRNRITESKEDGKRAAAEKEASYQTKIAELSATVATLTEKLRLLKSGSSSGP